MWNELPAAPLKLEKHQPRSYERALPNGVKRAYLSPSGRPQPAAMERALPLGCNVLEVCHLASPTANHSMFIFDRSMIHFQYLNGTNNWRLRGWGGWDPQGRNPLRDSGSKLYSAAIQLTSVEASNLRRLLEASWREQGPEGSAGASWENAAGQRAQRKILPSATVGPHSAQ